MAPLQAQGVLDGQMGQALADHDGEAEGQAEQHHYAGQMVGGQVGRAGALIADQAPVVGIRSEHLAGPGLAGQVAVFVEQQVLALVDPCAVAVQVTTQAFLQGAGQIQAGDQCPVRVVRQAQADRHQPLWPVGEVIRLAHVRFAIGEAVL
ncbi:hypothetical protein D3C84_200870 [compost metagenome]